MSGQDREKSNRRKLYEARIVEEERKQKEAEWNKSNRRFRDKSGQRREEKKNRRSGDKELHSRETRALKTQP